MICGMPASKAPTAWFSAVLPLTIAASYPWPDELIGYAGELAFGCGLALVLASALISS